MKTQKKKRNQPHTSDKIEQANWDGNGMCYDKKLAPRSLGGDSSDGTTISMSSKINRRYLK